MTPLKAAPELFCPECGAQNVGSPARCWLCYHPLPLEATLVEAPPVLPKPVSRRDDASASSTLLILTVFTAILVVLVGIGAFLSDTTLGVVYCVLVVPSLIVAAITYGVTRLRTAREPEASATRPWRASLTSFFISMAATLGLAILAVVVTVLVAVAAVIALIVQCFAALGGVG